MATLEEFVAAQDRVWSDVCEELRAGRKRSHWMWFVFPQLKSLGRSSTAQHYGLAGLDEAARYLAHPLLGPRLAEAAALLLQHNGTPPETILGPVDALKLRSSMTLFARVPGAPPVFRDVLDAFYGGAGCAETLRQTS